ncbi:MAG: aldehyde dehydrogenase family protein [Legionellales bacterium]|nr:aldehyde dehydrogenase family protein [Legionellales bacterium]
MEIFKQLGIQSLNSGAYAGCTWRSPATIPRLASINPTTGNIIAHISSCSPEDYHIVMEKALKAFASWKVTPTPLRGEVIRKIAEVLRQHKKALGQLISLEMGKLIQEGEGEVQEMIDMADFAVGQSRMLYGKTMHSERPFHRMYEQWHPYGVVGVISAFNFPVAVWAWNAFIAAICGNVTVWKPSSKTPLCAIAVHHLCQTVLKNEHLPDIFSLIIPASREITDSLVSDPRIPLVSFTGSTAVGREVGIKVAGRLGRSILELGGNNAVILDESANLDIALPAIVFGAVGTAGQRCTSTRRLFVHERIFDDLIKRLQYAYQQLTVGDPLNPKTLVGPLIDEPAVGQFQKAIGRIRVLGGRIICGGETIPREGCFVQPTLVSGLAPDCEMVKEETFAPILYVFPYHSLEEAIALQNSVSQGLSSALFTQTIQASELYLSVMGSDCGIANINIGTSGAEIGGAFGGEKETGGGREAGSDAWKSYMRRQTNTINWGKELPLAQGILFHLRK